MIFLKKIHKAKMCVTGKYTKYILVNEENVVKINTFVGIHNVSLGMQADIREENHRFIT